MNAILVQYGTSGFVSRFAAPGAFARGTRVIVRTPRGVECGTVLGEVGERFAPGLGEVGELLGPAAPDDDARLAALAARAGGLLATASGAGAEAGLPLAFVDAELTLDGVLILHGLAWGECDATRLFAELSERFGLTVRLLDLSRAPVAADPPPAPGCGKPGCGSAGGGCSSCGTGSEKGGCSSGGCSRGKVKSADKLTAYFADLRQKMEQAGASRTPLA